MFLAGAARTAALQPSLDRIRKGLVWLLRSPANRYNLSDRHKKGLASSFERGAREGTRIACPLVRLDKKR
jgi:hypothetical protein